MFGSGIPNPNITDETGIRIAEALENLNPEEGGGLPEVTQADAGKILGVTEDGEWDKMDAPDGLPEVTSADEGKVLGVNQDGEWDKMDAPSSERMAVHFEQVGEGPIICDKTYSEIKDYLDENQDGAIDVTLYQPNEYLHNAKCVSVDNHYVDALGQEVDGYCFRFVDFEQPATPSDPGYVYFKTIFPDDNASLSGWNIHTWFAQLSQS